MEIPAEVVDRNYLANLNNGEVLRQGTQLEEGMIVLIDDQLMRSEPLTDYGSARALITNRWCQVSNINFTDGYSSGNPIVSFTATYANGDIHNRTYNTLYTWIVKADSLGTDAGGPFCDWVSASTDYNTVTVRNQERDFSDYYFGGGVRTVRETAASLGMSVAPRGYEEIQPIIGEIDPALERLIQEEEEIEERERLRQEREDPPLILCDPYTEDSPDVD